MVTHKKFRVVESKGLPSPGSFTYLKEFDYLEEARRFLGEQVHGIAGHQFAILDQNGNMVIDEAGKVRGEM